MSGIVLVYVKNLATMFCRRTNTGVRIGGGDDTSADCADVNDCGGELRRRRKRGRFNLIYIDEDRLF
jgi:hypothetical protein